jgi:hypothetical protein
MTDRLLMEIADISIAIQSDRSPIQRNIFPAYQPFFKESPHVSGDILIEINSEMDGLPDTAGMRKIFDSEESWSMFSEGENYFLMMKPPVFPEPLWVARFDSSFTKATMFYGKACLSSEKECVIKPDTHWTRSCLCTCCLKKTGRWSMLPE